MGSWGPSCPQESDSFATSTLVGSAWWGPASVTEHLSLKLQQLPHETEVGGNDSPALLHKVKGLIQPHAATLYQVRQADGGGARDARLAVHQHATPAVLH